MKRIFSFVLSALLAVIFTTAHAQQNIFIWKAGKLSVKSVAETDSITSSVGSWLLSIRTSAATSVTTNTLEASVNVSYADNVRSLSQTQTPEVGVCFSSEKTTPTYVDEHKRLGYSLTSYDFTLSYLDPGTTYYYRAYVKLGDEVFYGNVKSITTFGKKPTYTLINGYEFVDLGLPSGLLWARTNMGASYASDDGVYLAWGEMNSKPCFDWSTYKWGNPCSKYNSSDGKRTLDAEDDAATHYWGAPCRMPDSSEFEELYNKCDWSWKSDYNGTSGYLVTGPNGNTIFFPASGYCTYDICEHGSSGYYWSGAFYYESQDANFAEGLVFHEKSVVKCASIYRCLGVLVRPVAKK